MKKQLLLLLALSCAGVSYGQFFSKEYGSTATDRLTDGTASLVGPAGHVMTGTSNIAGTTDLVLIRTDVQGLTPAAPFFRNTYRLMTPPGAPLSSTPVKVIQMPSGNIFVAGSYTGTAATDKGIYTAIFDPNGNLLSIRGWKTILTATTTITAASACRAATAADPTVFVTGTVDLAPYNTTLGSGVFVISLDGNTNVLNWSLTYAFSGLSGEAAADIIDSPYNSEVVVAGNFNNANDRGAFLLRVNRANGLPIAAPNIFNYTNSNESVSAISLNPNSVLPQSGFILCGTSNQASANNRMWVFKVNTTCNTVLANRFITYSVTTSSFTGSDIITRLNTSSQFEFYASGTAGTGQLGQNDMVVIKLSLALGILGEYTYGTAVTSESNAEIAAHSDGLGVYGNIRISQLAANADMYVAKAYYNGITACNSQINPGSISNVALTTTTTPVQDVKDLAFPGVILTQNSNVTIFNYCNSAAVVGGSNARVAQQEETSDVNAGVYPNPVSLSNPILNLNLNSATDQQIEIRITDMLGREVLNQKPIITEGQSLQTLQLPADIRPGVYLIMLNGEGIYETRRFVVE
ncbi:MAG: T9SS type A sorting domain-containing protein [Bacteroidia bacterium]